MWEITYAPIPLLKIRPLPPSSSSFDIGPPTELLNILVTAALSTPAQHEKEKIFPLLLPHPVLTSTSIRTKMEQNSTMGKFH